MSYGLSYVWKSEQEETAIMILIFILALVLPVSTSFWIVSTLLAAGSDEKYEPVSPTRWLLSILIPIMMAVYGLRKNSLDYTGAITGLFVGCIMTLSSYCFLTSMLCFFITSSKATKFRAHIKRKMEDNFKHGGQRNWVQVVCNGGVATELALLYMVDRGHGERVIDFTTDYRGSWLAVAVMAAIACCSGDTFASELGAVTGSTNPVLITTLQRVPRGTNGAISLYGLVYSSIGGLLVGAAYYTTLLLCVPGSVLENSAPQWPILLISTVAGLVGSLVDSLLGATVQYSGWNAKTGKVVEQPGVGVQKINGLALLDNHSVNLVSSVITALTVPRIAILLWESIG